MSIRNIFYHMGLNKIVFSINGYLNIFPIVCTLNPAIISSNIPSYDEECTCRFGLRHIDILNRRPSVVLSVRSNIQNNLSPYSDHNNLHRHNFLPSHPFLIPNIPSFNSASPAKPVLTWYSQYALTKEKSIKSCPGKVLYWDTDYKKKKKKKMAWQHLSYCGSIVALSGYQPLTRELLFD